AVDQYAGLEPSLVERIGRLERRPGARVDDPLFSRAVDTLAPQEKTEGLDGRPVLTLYRPLRNLEPCQKCHGSDHQVRGVVRVSLSLEALDQELRSARPRQLGVAALTIVGAAALLEQVKGELAKFVPEAVTRLLEQDPDARTLEKREADVSVLFLDVEGYTRLSEQLPPARLNRMIQDYFSAFLEIIRAHHGDVNETAGDGLMVIFQSEGSPSRHARNAAGTAFQLLGKVDALNQEFSGVYPAVAIHVGINSGPALVGA